MSKPFVDPESVDENRGKDSAQYRDLLQKIVEDGVCPFCPENLAKYHKNPILVEGKFWLATDNLHPYKGAKHHVLFVHRKHIEHVKDISAEAWSELLGLVQNEAKKRNIEGGTFFMRFGNTAHTGASVTHLHANLVSPDADDPNRQPIITRVG